MFYDSHSHTKFSADSEMSAMDALNRAKELGLGLVFTEHLDLDFPGEEDFSFSPQEYFQEYEQLKAKFPLRLGAEIGLTKESRKENAEFISGANFDQVIGSIHIIAGKDLYYPEAYDNYTKDGFMEKYFSVMAEEVEANDFDVLGHIDYVCRCMPYEDKEINYSAYQDLIDNVLKAVVKKGIVMELNTRRLADSLAVKELMPVYTRYKELGGKFITIGSDAHNVKTVGNNFKQALEIAEFCELKIVTFKDRQMEICSY